jgi:LmbE family N-acetylglucosaminyl deacetylase
VAWRPVTAVGRQVQRVLCYEVLSETHWNAPYLEPGFLPHRFEIITDTLDIKVRALDCFQSQIKQFPDIRSVQAIRALAQFRGAQVGVPAAEAFVVIREVQ